MKRYFTTICSLFVCILFAVAQHSIQSRVFDEKNGQPLEMVTIQLFNSSDSSFVNGAQTDVKGSFILNNIKAGRYYLLVTSIGYHEYKTNVSMENKNIVLKNIQLKENAQLLSEIEVKGTAAQMVVRGDTLEYNATAFKTAENAVVEDLIKRLPGVEVSSEGKITVNGEEIKKIRVDGKKFFGDDVEMATKNLPAEMIEKIQVLEEKSDMAKLTGFEDDETERIINLTTKPNRRRGLFSNINGGIGLDTENKLRYDGNAIVNFMEGNSQTTITGGANNVNSSRSSRGRGVGSNGVTTTQNFGVNNNTIVNDKFKVGGNGSFNHSRNEAITENYKLSYLKDSTYTDSTYTISHNENYSANIRLELEWKPDTLNTFIFQPNVSYTRSFNDSYRDFIYLVEDDTTSIGNSINYGNGTSFSGRMNIIYNRKFHKKGRTLTANIRGDLSQDENESFNYSYREIKKLDSINHIDQNTLNQSNRYNLNARVSYVEPLWNVKNLLEISATFQTTGSTSKKNQYDNEDLRYYDNLDNYTNFQREYTDFNEEYSNDFRNLFFRETVELNYRYTEKNYNLMLGMKGEPSQTYSYTTYGDGKTRNVDNEVFNFSPTGRFQYNFGKKEFIRIDYRGSTSQPSVNQMQPVKNNSDIMSETVGNPTLNPSFSHRFRLFYSTFNDQRFSSFNASLNFNATKDALVSNTIYDNSGKRYNQTVNSEKAPLSASANVMYNTPIIQKRLHFNTRTDFGFNQRYGYSKKGLEAINTDVEKLPMGDPSSTQVYNASENLSLTFTHDIVEVGARGSVSYRRTINNLNPNESETWDWTGSGNVVLHLPYNINISSDINYTTRQGYSSGFDRNELIWNASIDKSLFKNKGNISVRCFDILRQRLNIRQTVGDNYIQNSSYNTLTSYFLVSFSYKINKFPGAGKGSNSSEPQRPDGRFSPGGMREGGRPPMM
ncbi:hypothetical protein D0T49_09935 [Paludibacter sp. 221]|uniref:TonB-dependent receptor n=1 Tax=Paludibacter sp. 221 TaxID=2302939 RepID=UPI0013D0C9D8|nr:TonB-dependent receptor [Paludibacter sp. 221]NDV47364.1 hypothetical protein [Paludibacter sp. 221]